MEKNLSYYMALNYPITVRKYIENNGKEYFAVEIPDLPGCGTHGATLLEEALKRLDESKKLWIEASLKRDLDIAEPVDKDNFSGNFHGLCFFGLGERSYNYVRSLQNSNTRRD